MSVKTIRDVAEGIRRGSITPEDYRASILDESRRINKSYHYFCTLTDFNEAKGWTAEQELCGIPIAVKDSILVKGVESRAGSRILEGYVPVFSATCVERAQKLGGAVLGKTAQDEFGFGAYSVNVGIGFEVPRNPFDDDRSCGGSSGGAAGIVQKASFPMMSYGESTGGSIAEPAAFCGVFGMCPTYGLVSRYGLIDYANSLDKIGPIAKTAEDIAVSLNVMSGYDMHDSTSLDVKKEDYGAYLAQDIKGMKIGIITEGFGEQVDEGVKKSVLTAVEKLEGLGAKTGKVSTPTSIQYGVPTYYFLSTSEASTNLAKLCGMRFGKHEKLEGNFNEYFTKVRSMHFGTEAKRRIMIGTFARMAGYRDAYYIRAAKIRTLIINEYKKALKKYDILISPTAPMLPPKFSEIEKLTPLQHYMGDILTVGPNLAGLPHMSIPSGLARGLPVGMMAIADHLQEGKLLKIGKEFSYLPAE